MGVSWQQVNIIDQFAKVYNFSLSDDATSSGSKWPLSFCEKACLPNSNHRWGAGVKSERRNITLYAENDSAFRISWRNITCLFYLLGCMESSMGQMCACLIQTKNKKDVPVGVSKPGRISMLFFSQQHGRCIIICNFGLEEIYHLIWYFKLTVAQHQAMTMCSW